MSTKPTQHDIFWLSRYAHNKLAPLFAQAKAIEPTVFFSIEMTFSEAPATWDSSHISVMSHWKRKGMFQHSYCLKTQADVDRLAEQLRGDVADLKPLEVEVSA